jgi:hypothetical protein
VVSLGSLGDSLFVDHPAYGLGDLRNDLERFVFLLAAATASSCSARPGSSASRDYDGLGWFPGRAHSASSRSRVLVMLSIHTLPLSIPARFSSGAREQS